MHGWPTNVGCPYAITNALREASHSVPWFWTWPGRGLCEKTWCKSLGLFIECKAKSWQVVTVVAHVSTHFLFVSHEHPMLRSKQHPKGLPPCCGNLTHKLKLGQIACPLAPSGSDAVCINKSMRKNVDCRFKWMLCHKKTMPMEQHAASSVLSTPQRFKHFTSACEGVCPACSQHLVLAS